MVRASGGQKADVFRQAGYASIRFFSSDVQRMMALPTNGPGTALGEDLGDGLEFHRRLLAAVRTLQAQSGA